jgi:hypothetical protein
MAPNQGKDPKEWRASAVGDIIHRFELYGVDPSVDINRATMQDFERQVEEYTEYLHSANLDWACSRVIRRSITELKLLLNIANDGRFRELHPLSWNSEDWNQYERLLEDWLRLSYLRNLRSTLKSASSMTNSAQSLQIGHICVGDLIPSLLIAGATAPPNWLNNAPLGAALLSLSAAPTDPSMRLENAGPGGLPAKLFDWQMLFLAASAAHLTGNAG